MHSQSFIKTLRQPPKDAATISHKLLVRGGFISQLTTGVWNLLPLGFRVYKKVENIIRQEINRIGGQELFMPTMQPKELWQETKRWETIDPPLFKFQDRHKKWLALGSTHEENITDIVRKRIDSYKQLPFALYQIQNKFRNEMRATGGLLRCREFVMKDLYSFHQSEEDLDRYYQKVIQAYHKIYQCCSLKAVVVQASSGTIGGKESHEFMVLAPSGEDKILICSKCGWATNIEIGPKNKRCPECGQVLVQKNSIEAGHVFKLGIEYSSKMGANFVDKNGKQKPIVMGCYGIGLGRLMATAVEVYHDDKGICWPPALSPYDIHLVGLSLENKKVANRVLKVYQELKKLKFNVLFDDRLLSAGVKLKDADLIGISIRLIVSEKTGDKLELKERSSSKSEILTFEAVKKRLKRG